MDESGPTFREVLQDLLRAEGLSAIGTTKELVKRFNRNQNQKSVPLRLAYPLDMNRPYTARFLRRYLQRQWLDEDGILYDSAGVAMGIVSEECECVDDEGMATNECFGCYELLAQSDIWWLIEHNYKWKRI